MSILWVIGDSTLSEFNDVYYYPRYGYGTKLLCYLNDKIEVKNIALSGRSSLSYTKEPQYQELLDGMQKGDFLLIGFGHNDEKTEKERYTSPVGDYTTPGSFANSLYDNYIKNASKRGVSTILCTPIVRRTESGKWSGINLHITEDYGEYRGGDYAQAVRDCAEQLKLPLVDMTSLTKNLYDELGAEKTAYLHAWPSNNIISVDNTHTNVWGARVNAYLVMSSLKELNIAGLSENIINTNQSPIYDKDKYLISNKEYVPTVFSSDIPDSRIFGQSFGFKQTVFGDVLNNINRNNFMFETTGDMLENASIRIAVRNNSGKISEVTDGIAFVYKKVKMGINFELEATLKINDYFPNDQVSFGLMVRDDCYSDKKTPDILGDYVAAAPLYLTHDKETWSCFARRNQRLKKGGITNRAIANNEELTVRLSSSIDGYTAQFGDGPVITGGFDFKLAAIDPENVYVGFFAARNADVTFSNIKYREF